MNKILEFFKLKFHICRFCKKEIGGVAGGVDMYSTYECQICGKEWNE